MAPRKKAESAILKMYTLDPGELLVLERVEAFAAVCARIDAEVAAAPLTVEGSKGQPVANPLLLQQRKHAERLQRLIEGLRLPAKDETVGAAATSRAAQAAAQARWRRLKQRGA